MARAIDPIPITLRDLKPGTVRGGAGCFRVGQTPAGQWWLFAPDGTPFFGCGVNRVRRLEGGPAVRGAIAQLRGWGFNLLGLESAPEFRELGFPYLEPLELRRAGEVLFRLAGAQLPDVFDPRWPAACAERAAEVRATADLVGLVTDTELGWAQPADDGHTPLPTLLQICLSLDPRYAAYHAAWEFVLAPHAGDLAALARAWRVDLPNKETLRQWTHDDRAVATPGYREDHARFTREFAQRYYRTAATLLREQLPGRLIFGAPLPAGLPPGARETLAPWIDVSLADQPAAGGGPVFAPAFNWLECAQTPGPADLENLSPLERMHRSGRALLESLVADPSVVGYSWSDYAAGDLLRDAPFGGGLLYDNGWPAHENAQPLAAINARAVLRRQSVG